MENIENQIVALIKQSLPDQMRGAFKSYVDDIESKVSKLARLESENANLKEEFNKVKENYTLLLEQHKCLVKELETRTLEIEDYKQQEKGLEKRERDISILEMKHELSAEQRITKNMFDLVSKVFSNPTFVHKESGKIPVVLPGTQVAVSPNGSVHSGSYPIVLDQDYEKTTTTETK